MAGGSAVFLGLLLRSKIQQPCLDAAGHIAYFIFWDSILSQIIHILPQGLLPKRIFHLSAVGADHDI